MSTKLPIRRIGVVGAGTMGHGIAQVFAQDFFTQELELLAKTLVRVEVRA